MSAILELTKPEATKAGILYGISWEIYEELLEKYRGYQYPPFTYDSGVLEVYMPVSTSHEENTYILTKIVDYVALELEVDLRNFGSATYKRKTIGKGFEPYSGFYIQSLNLIEGKTDLNFEKDPPPNLIIEVNRTSSSLPRMPIFAAFGIKEVWRFDGKNVKFYTLEEGVYLEMEKASPCRFCRVGKRPNFCVTAAV